MGGRSVLVSSTSRDPFNELRSSGEAYLSAWLKWADGWVCSRLCIFFGGGKPMAFHWRPTNAPVQTRYDDIWFISPQVGWAVNSAGQIRHTEDAGATWP